MVLHLPCFPLNKASFQQLRRALLSLALLLLMASLAAPSQAQTTITPMTLSLGSSTVISGQTTTLNLTLSANVTQNTQVTFSWTPSDLAAAANITYPNANPPTTPLTSPQVTLTLTPTTPATNQYQFKVWTSVLARKRVLTLSATVNGSTLQASSTLTITPVYMRIMNVQAPNTVLLNWDTPIPTPTPPQNPTNYSLKRTVGSTTTTLSSSLTAGSTAYTDTTVFADGDVVLYEIRTPSNVVIAAERCALYTKTALANQTADARIDRRDPNQTNPYLDFQFVNRTYRGGLYAGDAGDNSKFGRSYLRFSPVTVPYFAGYPNSVLRVGNVNAYFTGIYGSASGLDIGCQPISNYEVGTGTPLWDQATLKWSKAPAMTPSAGVSASTGLFSGQTPYWTFWDMSDPLVSAMASSDHALSVGLSSKGEATAGSGWAYFAKKEYTPIVNMTPVSYPPTLTYAWAIPTLIDIQVTPTTINVPYSAIETTGTQVNALVEVNGIELANTATVTIMATYTGSIPLQVYIQNINGITNTGANTWTMDVTGWTRSFSAIVSTSSMGTGTSLLKFTVTYGPRSANTTITAIK